jgi:hypothetical protein
MADGPGRLRQDESVSSDWFGGKNMIKKLMIGLACAVAAAEIALWIAFAIDRL